MLIVPWPEQHDRIADLEAAIGRLDAAVREPQPESEDDPVFIASIGWRSGSTLLQRVVMTDPSILVWGEPLAHLLFLDQLTEPLFGFTETWPTKEHWISHREDLSLTKDWVATLSPDAGRLKAAYRAFFDQWLAIPARERGFSRWGVKQVRWKAEDGIVLRWLYPKAKFIVIVRHPVSAYHSMRNFGFVPNDYAHIVKWPTHWVFSVDDYANYWNSLVLGWREVSDRLGVTWIRYEDFVEGRTDMRALADQSGLSLKVEEAMEVRVGGSHYQVEITAEERDRINALTAPARGLLGYVD